MHPHEAFARFQKHNIALLQAGAYLLTVEIEALRDHPTLSKQHEKLKRIIGNTYEDPHHYFMARLFISYVSAFEIFLQETATCVVELHPLKLGSTQFRLSDVLQAESKSALINRAIEQSLNSLMYKRPAEYRSSLSELLSVDLQQFNDYWNIWIEAKARRDLGVHADWICNETYLRKLEESQIPTTLELGVSAVPDSKTYLEQVSDGLYELAKLITEQVIEKHFADTKGSFLRAVG